MVDEGDEDVLVRDQDGWLRVWAPWSSPQPGPPTVQVRPDAWARVTGTVAAVAGLEGTPDGVLAVVSLPSVSEILRVDDGCGVALGVRDLHAGGRAVVLHRERRSPAPEDLGFSYVRVDCRNDFPAARPAVHDDRKWVHVGDDGVARLYWMDDLGELRAATLDVPELTSPGVALAP